MPFVKRTLGTEIKSTNRRRKRRQGKLTVRKLNQKVNKMEKKLEGALEQKFRDTNISTALPILSGSSTLMELTLIAEGTGDQSRVGEAIHVDSIYSKLLFRHNGAGSVTPHTLRILLLKDKASQGDNPELGFFLQNSSGLAAIYSPYDRSKIRGFNIIQDNIVTLVNGSDSEVHSYEFYWKNKKLSEKTTFIGNAGTETQRFDNHYYILLISDQAANGPTVEGNVRLTYLDA